VYDIEKGKPLVWCPSKWHMLSHFLGTSAVLGMVLVPGIGGVKRCTAIIWRCSIAQIYLRGEAV